jgi:hypothetical protein
MIRPYLFTPEGYVRSAPLDTSALDAVVQAQRERLLGAVLTAFRQGWPADDLEVISEENVRRTLDGLAGALQNVVVRLFNRLLWALGQLERLSKVAANKGALDSDEEALRARCERLVKKLQRRGAQARQPG